MRIDIISLFPEFIEAFYQHSIIGRARAQGLLELDVTNPRSFVYDRHRMVDDTIYGGGCGMLMKAGPLFAAVESVRRDVPRRRVILMGPAGSTFNQAKARELAAYDQLILLCGHYEGVDQRVIDCWEMEEVSIGDYILTGGELPAMVLVDSVARLIPGVLSGEDSAMEESVYSGLLEYPQYTQPREYEDIPVPEILLSGHHQNIDLWRFEKSLELTRKVRPDMFENYCRERTQELDKAEKKILQKVTDEK